MQYVKDACNYLYETYGRFPAHVDAFYSPGMWLQFSHLEMEYYDRFFDPSQYTRQAAARRPLAPLSPDLPGPAAPADRQSSVRTCLT